MPQSLSKTKILGVVGDDQKIKRSLESSLLPRIAGDRLAPGKPISLVEPELGARQACIRRQRGVQVSVAEVGTIPAGALGLRTGHNLSVRFRPQHCSRFVATGSEPRKQRHHTSQRQGAESSSHRSRRSVVLQTDQRRSK